MRLGWLDVQCAARKHAAASVTRFASAAALIAALFLVASPVAAEKKNPAQQITDDIICPCSCGEVLTGCTCETAKGMQAFVTDELKNGKGKDQIEAELVSKYGEVILGAPKPKGFNLIVWVAPFAATILGLGIATFILLRWVRRRSGPALGGPALAGGAAGGGVGAAGGGGPAGGGAQEDFEALRARAEAEIRRLSE